VQYSWEARRTGGRPAGAVLETATPSKERTRLNGAAKKPQPTLDSACFNDWKRFCFVLREIASGENGRPVSGSKAQKLAQAVLVGYVWQGGASELLRSTPRVEPKRDEAAE
jgi:hypothetical protein